MGSHDILFIWAISLLAQNFLFVLVSRTSGWPPARRAVAMLAFNAAWILQFQLLIGPMFPYLNGSRGLRDQILMGGYYTLFAASGSIIANWLLVTKKQSLEIDPEEWDRIRFATHSCPMASPQQCPIYADWPGFSEKIDEIAAHARGTKVKLALVMRNEKEKRDADGGDVQCIGGGW